MSGNDTTPSRISDQTFAVSSAIAVNEALFGQTKQLLFNPHKTTMATSLKAQELLDSLIGTGLLES